MKPRERRVIGAIRASKPPEAKVRAVTQVNPIRPRYTKTRMASLPEVWKPATGGEATGMSSHRVRRGDWGRRVPKD